MKKIILAMMLTTGFMSCEAQPQQNTVKVITYKLPTQTELVSSGEKLIKIKSSNDSVIQLLAKHYSKNLTKFSKSIKKDRYGTYQEYTMYFPKEYTISIIETLNTLIK